MAEEYNMGSLNRLNEQQTKKPSMADLRRLEETEAQEAEESQSGDNLFPHSNNAAYGDSLTRYNLAEKELIYDTLNRPEKPNKEDYANLPDYVQEVDGYNEALKNQEFNKDISSKNIRSIKSETGLDKTNIGKYTREDGERASAKDAELVSEKFKVLDSTQQKEALKSLNVDTGSLIEEKSDDGSIHYRDHFGQYYQVGVDNGKTILLSTTSHNGEIKTDVFELNKFHAQINPDYAQNRNFEVSDEEKLKDAAQSLGINMDDYSIAQSEDGTVHLRSNDGKKFFKVGVNLDTGKTQIVSTRMRNGESQTNVYALPDKSLNELTTMLNEKKELLETLKKPDKKDFGGRDEKDYKKAVDEYYQSGENVKHLKVTEEIAEIEKEINKWQGISKQL